MSYVVAIPQPGERPMVTSPSRSKRWPARSVGSMTSRAMGRFPRGGGGGRLSEALGRGLPRACLGPAGRTSTQTARITRRKKRKMRAITHHWTSRTAPEKPLAAKPKSAADIGRSGELEDDGGSPDGDLVATHEQLLPDRIAVHAGAVGGTEVGDDHPVSRPAELGMTPAHVRVVQHDVAFG